MKKKLVEVPGTTLPFYTYEQDGLTFFEFNATECNPPEPMINTIKGLSLLKSNNDRLVGIFFHEPFPLYERIPFTISHEAVELDSGDFQVTFKKSE
ncbi:hypothetical protein SMGD1_0014 [Sulfurimonas gotlandica GD1]|uniref:DUF2249 domain-containing protein n=1 Tax=Sulfurimonas gotlandica (strain DSM 19862 / JCM 16533 / GD1) TaxID=929558 RepID=B6BL88_SULGG|nr:hypothetical protein [Sulfurimonas gotlandica]EDZ62117.1 conserved hypothetical protein [Sulfurimonas gotlandica GD1]EHP28541.1 hypothetical protein SMGD1_0014 [Sulfurimonas gotlandica GD1]